MFFVKGFLVTIASCRLFKNDWILINHGLFFREKYSLQLLFPVLKIVDNLQFFIPIMDKKVLVLCNKRLFKFLSNIYVLRPPE